jgi:hypothetical protein
MTAADYFTLALPAAIAFTTWRTYRLDTCSTTQAERDRAAPWGVLTTALCVIGMPVCAIMEWAGV